VGVRGAAASKSARRRCHPTRRASRHSRCFASAFFVRKTAAGGRLLLPLQGRWGDFVAAVVRQQHSLRERIFSSEFRFVPLAHGRRRKFNSSHTRNARFSVAYGRASAQFHCCLTRRSHPLTGAASCSRKGRQPVTPTDGAGAVPAGGGSSLPLSGGPGIDPAGITTGARGASLKRGAKVRVTPARCIA
jgi:hypothetical protein